MNFAGSGAAPGSWQWSEDVPNAEPGIRQRTATGQAEQGYDTASSPPPEQQAHSNTDDHGRASDQGENRRQKHYKPRQCRICLETVLPSFDVPESNLPGIFQSRPKVVYRSEDGGRLLRPCKCKGTQQYVHEDCLQAWRHSDPDYGKRNYWQCPTCQYRYHLQRLGWGRWISSVAMQVGLTVLILLTTVFILGFIADPIINFCLDPYGSIWARMFGGFSSSRYEEYQYDDYDGDPDGWVEHFTKGFASLGLISFFKVVFSNPFQFFYRSTAIGSRGGTTGRDRLNGATWLVIVVGALTFMFGVWKVVRGFSRRLLEKAGERVMDVQGDDDEDADEEHQHDT